ncbi:MAG: hypothetical protein K6E76_08395 [Patescibacteria group bacterium]|nr:hypothetical protein [Patescibacteria group bacterium]
MQNSIQGELKTLLENINSTDQATVDNIQKKRDTLSLRTDNGAKEFLRKFLEHKYSISDYSTTARMAAQTLLRKK